MWRGTESFSNRQHQLTIHVSGHLENEPARPIQMTTAHIYNILIATS